MANQYPFVIDTTLGELQVILPTVRKSTPYFLVSHSNDYKLQGWKGGAPVQYMLVECELVEADFEGMIAGIGEVKRLFKPGRAWRLAAEKITAAINLYESELVQSTVE